MFVVTVEFLHDTFRADPDGVAHTGRAERGEWPPSPARLFAALVAADGTRDRCRVTDGSELTAMEAWPPPRVHADPDPWHQVLEPRYVVQHTGSAVRNTHQEYVGRGGVLVRPGVRVALRHPRVVYAWEIEPPPVVSEALHRRAARVGYLGAADSPVRVTVGDSLPHLEGLGLYEPADDGDVFLSCPRPGHLAVLDAAYDAWVEHGAAIGRAQFPALRNQVRYRSPFAPPPEPDRGGVAAWLVLGRAVSGRRITPLVAAFKAAVLSQYQRLEGEPPALLHGHGYSEPGYELARFLALPDVGFRHSKGRIHGLALWLPPGVDGRTRGRAADAARSVRRLSGPGVDVEVEPWAGQSRPWAAHPQRWQRASRRWVTAFPALHERRGRDLDRAEVGRWCRHAGLPEPIAVRSARGPLVHGAVDLSPVEVNRPGRPGRPYSHVEMVFAGPVFGPVVVGAGRQRGLGLCVQVDERATGAEAQGEEQP